MTTRDSYAPGEFSWIDLSSPDIDASKAFYGGLFGWTCEDQFDDGAMVYVMAKLDGRDVAGMGAMPQEMQAAGVPPHWSSYVTVEDADKTVAKATELGATVMLEPMDVMDVGRMAIFADPGGAVISIWQPSEHKGAGVVTEPGSFCWNELNTRELDGAKSFYSDLFGWSLNTQDMGGGMSYTEIQNEGRPNGGMLEMNEQMGDIPPHWAVYFAVSDADASAAQAKELGATVHVPPTDIQPGRFSVIQDPQGAVFTILQMKEGLASV